MSQNVKELFKKISKDKNRKPGYGIHVILLIRKSHYFKEMLFLPAVD